MASKLFVFLTALCASECLIQRPCPELSPELRHFPCDCELLSSPLDEHGGRITEESDPTQIGVAMSCNGVTFAAETPQLPRGAPIYRYKHTRAGLRSPPLQLFSNGAPLAPLRFVDLSNNSMRRLSGGHLYALRDTLTEIRLGDNLLGDTLNPILSTGEFRGLGQLLRLDISRNGIRALEAGILRGCDKLQQLLLDGNRLMTVPAAELGGPLSLKLLSLKDNMIRELSDRAFPAGQIPRLEYLDLSGNNLERISGGAFVGVPKLVELRLSQNRLVRFDSDAFEGPGSLRLLDLADNYLSSFPGVALTRHAATLTYLDISSNRIKQLNEDLAFPNLEWLNLSRNEISNLPSGTFGMKRLKYLNLGVNSLRAIEDDAFEGLDSLETLVLTDNNILLIPASSLSRLPRLTSIRLDFNRIAAVSGDIVTSEHAQMISLARNVIRELPDGTFKRCKDLRKLDLSGNLLNGIPSPAIFIGTEDTLKELDLSYNKLTGVSPGITFTQLESLDLSNNRVGGLSPGTFSRMPELRHLNLSRNPRLGSGLSADILNSPLVTLDLSHIGLRHVPVALLSSAPSLVRLNLSSNSITELSDRSFYNLRNLTHIDLSNNRITAVKPHAFINVMSIRTLILHNNRLVSYGGETFNTGTGLEHLDLSSNRLAYMSPTSFRIHPRLKRLSLSDNRLTYFPAAELISGLQYLEQLDLAGNKLAAVEELDFARMPRLRTLSLSDNTLESIGDLAFHNSTQLQYLDLSSNRLVRFAERAFEGLVRLRLLNMSHNQLNELSDTLFDRSRIQAIDRIDLSNNDFVVAPLQSLRRQHFALTDVDLSHNRLTTVPADDTVLVNVEKLDLSHNPLSEEAVSAVLSEPKTVRVLNLAHTGLKRIRNRLETPFLRYLNLSSNNITEIDANAFERTSLLETIDLSTNTLTEVSKMGTPPPVLTTLVLSNNPIERISSGDLKSFGSLRMLDISKLPVCARIEKDAFGPLRQLTTLDAFGYPRLGYLDVKGLLRNLPGLERLNIECMDSVFGGGSESTTSELHPVRLNELGVHGTRLNAIAPGALSGLRAKKLTVRFLDTSLTSVPPTMFFPVPRSTDITLDISRSLLSAVPSQLISAIEDRRGKLSIIGLETVPLSCDCTTKPLRQYLTSPNHVATEWAAKLRCSTPEKLNGILLSEVSEEGLQCVTETSQKIEITSSRTRPTTSSVKTPVTAPAEPDIIWSVEPRPPSRSRLPPASTPLPSVTPNNDDTLIIGIVGGVVSFIAILIIGICIVRLKTSGSGHQHARPMSMGGPGSVYACSSVKGAPSLYAAYPPHTATLCR